MLQYLLNSTAIWLLSLAVFDLFLRRESYHGYNRAYLLCTFLAGICIPLVKWRSAVSPAAPIETVYTLKEIIITSKAAATTISWQNIIVLVYCIGVLASVALLIVDIVKLIRLYRMGAKSAQGEWTVIETGKPHAPFSFFNLLFVSDKESYSPEEWQMLSAHEAQHKNLYHFADLLLLQLSRIIFWFHPLIHIYYRRLMLVHEYQADVKAKKRVTVYGRFLIEQSVLNTAPAITHSFNRSPIKKRIIMLTKTSSKGSKLKMAVLLPVTAICFTCFSATSFAQQKQEKAEILTHAEIMPKALYDLSEYLSNNLHYPEIARQNKVEGKVIIKFVVDEHGRVTDPEIVRGIGGSCDEEALRVVKNMPMWIPASDKGKPVKVYYHLPIMFSLGS
jgi:TonB family protein